MKKILSIATLFLALTITLTGCSKEKRLANRLEGTWNIDELKTLDQGIGTPTVIANIGTFTFKDDNTGSVTISFLGQSETTAFTWSNTATTVTLNVSGEPQEILTVSTNEKTKQVWTNTDSDGTVSTWTLSKK